MIAICRAAIWSYICFYWVICYCRKYLWLLLEGWFFGLYSSEILMKTLSVKETCVCECTYPYFLFVPSYFVLILFPKRLCFPGGNFLVWGSSKSHEPHEYTTWDITLEIPGKKNNNQPKKKKKKTKQKKTHKKTPTKQSGF